MYFMSNLPNGRTHPRPDTTTVVVGRGENGVAWMGERFTGYGTQVDLAGMAHNGGLRQSGYVLDERWPPTGDSEVVLRAGYECLREHLFMIAGGYLIDLEESAYRRGLVADKILSYSAIEIGGTWIPNLEDKGDVPIHPISAVTIFMGHGQYYPKGGYGLPEADTAFAEAKTAIDRVGV